LHEDGFTSVSFASDRPLSVTRFQHFLDTGRPPGLFRGKGFLWLAETDKRYIFHLVGNRFSLDEDARTDPGANRLVLIGRDLDEPDLRTRLASCLAAAP
jgi:G3E family GTPase